MLPSDWSNLGNCESGQGCAVLICVGRRTRARKNESFAATCVLLGVLLGVAGVKDDFP